MRISRSLSNMLFNTRYQIKKRPTTSATIINKISILQKTMAVACRRYYIIIEHKKYKNNDKKK